MVRSLHVLVFSVVFVVAATSSLQSKVNSLQSDCRKMEPCREDIDCECSNDKVVCNFKQVCDIRNFIDDLVRRKPCFRRFKQYCKDHRDCNCGDELICEDSECVENRRLGSRTV